jgi:glycosyltransferase involved in cell wall biosynthesis
VSLAFSVIVPTYKRREALRSCMQALARQTYPKEAFEVVVIDDGGSDSLKDLEDGFHGQLRLRLRRQKRSGPATARNHGAHIAHGEYLAFTDDDCEPSPDWLEMLQHSLIAHPNALVGGRVVNALPRNSCSAASQQLVDYLYCSYTDNGVPRFFASNNFALSSRAFRDAGGFDESYPLPAAEDRDFCARWTQSGRSMVYAPAALVYHAHALNVPGFVQQHFRYGRGAYHFRKRTVSRGHRGPKLEPLSFYGALLAYPLKSAKQTGLGSLRVSLLFVLSQIANAAGFFREAFAMLIPLKGKP